MFPGEKKKKSYLADVQRLNKSSFGRQRIKTKQQQIFKLPNETKAEFIPKGIPDETKPLFSGLTHDSGWARTHDSLEVRQGVKLVFQSPFTALHKTFNTSCGKGRWELRYR